jgi:membrane protein YqaA with SNARE-associated domain
MIFFDVHYIILGLIVLAINIVPAFMPSTWMILSFFYIHYHLEFLPTIFIGVTLATIGRIILAILAKDYIEPILPKKEQENMINLGKIFALNKNFTFLSILGYTFLPIPSNQLFIAAGLAKADLSLIALSFFIGRTISYSFWVNLSRNMNENIEGTFINHFSNKQMFIVEILGFAILYLISKINWGKVLRYLKKKTNQDESDHSK